MKRGYGKSLVIAVAMTALCVGSSGAWAQTTYLTVPEPAYGTQASVQHASATRTTPVTSASYNDLEQRIKAIEVSMAEEAKAEEWIDGSKGWENKFGGRILWDYQNFANQSAANLAQYGDSPDYNEFRSVRFFMAGKGYGIYEYKFEVTLEDDDGDIGLTDAYVGMDMLPVAGKLQIGQRKAFMGMEKLTSERFLLFMERAAASEFFSPSYRLGLHQTRNIMNDSLLVQSGVLFGDSNIVTKQVVDDRQGIRVLGRAVYTPIYQADGRAVLHIGGGAMYAKANESIGIRPDTHEGTQYINLGSLGYVDSYTGNLELALASGPAVVESELFVRNYQDTAAYGSATAYGAYVQGAYFLTGEQRPYSRASGTFGRVKPLTNFWLVADPCGGCNTGWGAWALAMRYDYIDFTDFKNGGALVNTAGTVNNLTLGVNWYWNPHTRMTFNYVHSMPNTVAGNGGVYNSSNADILGMRFQVDW